MLTTSMPMPSRDGGGATKRTDWACSEGAHAIRRFAALFSIPHTSNFLREKKVSQT
ncbi:hypothetical protein ZHAS_00006495 [Anopheles sinensis]|uniref:Uncharacterized protein n=1 Tax=Anopheles sinensis TaxID=74873 RepID=A0A084VMG5_ANOSI|nr:hypothetical protein ZHAS_00006495 [Anopheles sinensis]